jgi:hypothetical protein
MPFFPNDKLIPGSERAYEAVNNRQWNDIVRDLRNGPSALPIVTPEPHPVGSGWVDPKPLGPPEGDRYVGQICDAFSAQERVAKIEELTRRVANLQSARDAEIKELKDEVARLQAELAKVASP